MKWMLGLALLIGVLLIVFFVGSTEEDASLGATRGVSGKLSTEDLPDPASTPAPVVTVADEPVSMVHEPADAPIEAPERVVGPGAIFRGLPGMLHATVFGAMDGDALLEASLDLLACLRDRSPDRIEGGAAVFEYEDPSGARMTIRAQLEASAGKPELAMFAKLPTAAGWISGYVEDGSKSSSVELHFDFDDGGEPKQFSSLAQTPGQQSAELFELLSALDESIPQGGYFAMTTEGANWRQSTTRPVVLEDGEPGWNSTLGLPEPAEGTLEDPRALQIAQAFGQLRSRITPPGK